MTSSLTHSVTTAGASFPSTGYETDQAFATLLIQVSPSLAIVMASRRIRSIYDAIDAGNFRQALKLVRSAEAKLGQHSLLVALRALSLEQLDRYDECLEACTEFLTLKCTDPPVLDSMKPVFKAIDRLDMNISAYELACKEKRDDESLLTGLYFANVREHKYLRCQQVAISLFRYCKHEKYLRWAVLNMELQHMLAESTSSPRHRLLELADMMLAKHEESETIARTKMHVRVLQGLKNDGKLLMLLQGSAGERWAKEEPVEYQLVLANTLMKNNSLVDARNLFKSFLTERNADDFQVIKKYIQVQLVLSRDIDAITNTVVAETQSFLHTLQTCENGNLRGPYLGGLELELRRLHDASSRELHTTTSPIHLESLVVDYFQRFSALPSCFSDLRRYASACERERLHNLLSHDVELIVPGQIQDPLSLVSRELMNRLLAPYVKYSTPNDGLDACILAARYLHEKWISHKVSRLALLAAHALIDAFELSVLTDDGKTNTGDGRFLFDAIYVLENALVHAEAQHDFQLRFLLIRLYCHPLIGGALCALNHFRALDIKQVQLETLSHLIVDDLLRYACVHEAQVLVEELISFHTSHSSNEAEFTILAYRGDNLEQVIDFAQFNMRLHHSVRLAASRSLRSFCRVLLSEKDTNSLNSIIEQQLQELRSPNTAWLSSLRSNADESLLLLAESFNSPRHIQLNRPMSFFHVDSWTHTTSSSTRECPTKMFLSVNERELNTTHIGAKQSAIDAIRFVYISLLTTQALIQADSKALRIRLNDLRALLLEANLVSNEPFVFDPDHHSTCSMSSIENDQWELCCLCLETSACIIECRTVTLHALSEILPGCSSKQSLAIELDNTTRWAALHRQIELQRALMHRICDTLQDALHAHVGESSVRLLPALSMFVNFGASWTAISCTVWSQQVMSKPAYTNWRKKMSNLANIEHHSVAYAVEEEIVTAMYETRCVLRSFVSKTCTTLMQLETQLCECVELNTEKLSGHDIQERYHDTCMNTFMHHSIDAIRCKVDKSIETSHMATIKSVLDQLSLIRLTLTKMKF